MVVCNRVELFELHAFYRFELIFQLLQRQHARLALVQGFRQQRRRLYRRWQPLDGERFNVDFTVATGNLLQAHTHHHALMAGVNDVQNRITDARFQLTVQTFITGTACGPRFGGVTEVKQRQVRDQRRDKGRHGGGFTRPVTAGERRDQLIQIERSGKEAVPVNQRQ